MSDFSISGVYDLPTHRASAAFISKTSEVFKEDDNITPIIIYERMQYIRWQQHDGIHHYRPFITEQMV